MLSLRTLQFAPLHTSRLLSPRLPASLTITYRQFSSKAEDDSEPSEPEKRVVPAPAWLPYSQDRNAYRKSLSALRSRYLADHLAGLRAEALARKAEQEEGEDIIVAMVEEVERQCVFVSSGIVDVQRPDTHTL